MSHIEGYSNGNLESENQAIDRGVEVTGTRTKFSAVGPTVILSALSECF